MLAFLFSFSLLTVPPTIPSPEQTTDYIRNNMLPVIQFATDWGTTAGLSLISTQAFLVVCKRFLE